MNNIVFGEFCDASGPLLTLPPVTSDLHTLPLCPPLNPPSSVPVYRTQDLLSPSSEATPTTASDQSQQELQKDESDSDDEEVGESPDHVTLM